VAISEKEFERLASLVVKSYGGNVYDMSPIDSAIVHSLLSVITFKYNSFRHVKNKTQFCDAAIFASYMFSNLLFNRYRNKWMIYYLDLEMELKLPLALSAYLSLDLSEIKQIYSSRISHYNSFAKKGRPASQISWDICIELTKIIYYELDNIFLKLDDKPIPEIKNDELAASIRFEVLTYYEWLDTLYADTINAFG